jgi:hypothetical protein
MVRIEDSPPPEVGLLESCADEAGSPKAPRGATQVNDGKGESETMQTDTIFRALFELAEGLDRRESAAETKARNALGKGAAYRLLGEADAFRAAAGMVRDLLARML